MDETKTIKVITPSRCPLCNGDIHVCVSQVPASLNWVLDAKVIEQNKKNLKKKLDEIKFKNKGEKELIFEWLKNEATIIGPEDVESLFQQILADQNAKEVQDKNKS